METFDSMLPLLACLAPLLAVPAIVAIGERSPNVREGVTVLTGFVVLLAVLSMLKLVIDGNILRFTFIEVLPGVAIEFRVDGLGILFALVASSLWILTSIYTAGYMRGAHEINQTRFFAFFAVSISATLGVAFSGNLFTLYLFYEVLSLSTWPLVTHHGDKEARTGGRTYLTYLMATSIGFALPAMIYTYVKSGGSLDFTVVGVLGQSLTGVEASVLLLLFVFGFSKAGVMPFHSWLPGAMVAPTPVSALLHAVAVVKVGVFCILRVFTGVFGVDLIGELDAATAVSWIAGTTVLVSSLIALSQDNLKRRLAFSTIGQLSYIVLGVSLLSEYAVQGSMMHIAMHAFGKITLFFCAGAIYVACGKKYVSQLDGIGKAMPFTMGAFAIGAMSVTGLPPTGGLLSKIYLVWGAADVGEYALLAIFFVSTILNGAYFFPIVYRAFFHSPPEGEAPIEGIKEAPFACVFPLCLTAIASVLLFFFPDFLLELTRLIFGAK
ncbi:MAG: monovalent cation/H+ antiporter subunit D family protein [Verrucomicrobiota bacterium]